MAAPVPSSSVPTRSLHRQLSLFTTKLRQAVQLYCCAPRATLVVRGRCAIERALRLQHYSRTTSAPRVSMLVSLSPLPILALLLAVDVSIPLSDPRLGPAHNVGAFARSVVANAMIALCGELLMLQTLGIPTRPGLAASAAGLALLIAAVADTPWVVAAFTLGYPVPAKHMLNGASLLMPLALCVFVTFKFPAASSWARRRRRVVRSSLAIVIVRIFVAMLLSVAMALFATAPLWGRVLLLITVRVAKVHYQRYLHVLAARLPGAGIETAAVSGEAVFAVFYITCFQAEPSIWLVIGIVAVDVFEVVVHLRSISQLSLEHKSGSQVWSAAWFARSAITATPTSIDRMPDDDDPPTPSTSLALELNSRQAMRQVPEINIEFPRELFAAQPCIRVSRSAKIYCAQSKNPPIVTKYGLMVHKHALPSRNLAPSIVGNCTRQTESVETANSLQPRANEPPSATRHRQRSGRSSRQSLIERRTGSISASKSGISIKKRCGRGETARLRDLLVSCETLLLEKFIVLLLLVIYAAAVRMLWSLPNARFNLFLACLTADELLEREVLGLAYIGAELALMVFVAWFAHRLGVRALFLVGYALEHYPVVMYAEIISYCFYALQKFAAHHHALQNNDGCSRHDNKR